MNIENSMSCFECGGTQFLALDYEKKVCLKCGMLLSPNSRLVNKKSEVIKDKEKTDINKPIRPPSLLNIWEQSVKINDSHEKNIVTALTEITRLGDHFSTAPQVLDDASTFYRRLIEKRHIKRYKIEALAAAVFYISCRNNGKQISMSDIEKASNISRKELAKSIRLFLKELNIKVKRRKQASPKYPHCCARALSLF